MSTPVKLSGLSDIYRFFRTNTTPIYFVSPTAYNILGLGQWIQGFKYITQLANEAGVASAPNIVDVEASSYEELRALATENNLGEKLVVQTPYGGAWKNANG